MSDSPFYLFANGEVAEPLRPRKLGQFPTSWGAFFRGLRPRKSLPLQGRWASVSDARRGSAASPLPRTFQHNGATSLSTALYIVPINPVRQSLSFTSRLSLSIFSKSFRTSSRTAPP